MAVEHVEINKIGEEETARLAPERLTEFGHAIGVVFCGDVVFDAAAVVDIVNLADAENADLGVGENVKEHGTRWFDSVIMAALSAPIISRRASKRSRDDASHAMRTIEKFARDLAHFVELSNRNGLLVRRDLKNAVARRVDDRIAGALMLLPEFLDDFRAGGGLVANGFAANGALEFLDQVAWETVFVYGKGLIKPDTAHFPVASGRVLAGGNRDSLPERADRMPRRVEMRERFYVRQAEAHEIRQTQRPRAGDVTERVAAHVAVIGGIGKLADADAIENDPDDSRKWGVDRDFPRLLQRKCNTRGIVA